MEVLKEMAETGKKVKEKDDEIKVLHKDIEEQKEEVLYLRNKLDFKRDIIDDLEI